MPAQICWNPALVLTLLRAILILPFLFFFLRGASAGKGSVILLLLFGIIALSDFLDGPLARRRHQVSTFGSVADVLADITFILSSLWTAAYVGLIPWWVPAAIVVQVLQFIGDSILLFSKTRRGPFRENRLGKMAGALYYVLVGVLCFYLLFPRLFPEHVLSLLSTLVFSYTMLCILMRTWLYRNKG